MDIRPPPVAKRQPTALVTLLISLPLYLTLTLALTLTLTLAYHSDARCSDADPVAIQQVREP